MTYTPEDGSGMVTANAYGTIAYLDAYHDDRGRTASWTAKALALKQAAAIRATDHIDRVYGPRFRGWRQSKEQALEWPRGGGQDNDGFAFTGVDVIPRALLKAWAEYSLRALLVGELTPDIPPPVPAQDLAAATAGVAAGQPAGRITSIREKLGPIETETHHEPAGGSELLPMYPAADAFLRELLISPSTVEIVRG